MKIRWMLLLLCLTFLPGGPCVLAREQDPASEAESGTDSLIWTQYFLQINDEAYKFPMRYECFTSRGWICEPDTEVLEPRKHERYLFRRDDQTCFAYLLNPSDKTLPLSECQVAGIVIEEHDWLDLDSTISLPGDIVCGISTGEDILRAYGEPSELCEGVNYTVYSYREDLDREVELEVDSRTGLLQNIRIENFAESNITKEDGGS